MVNQSQFIEMFGKTKQASIGSLFDTTSGGTPSRTKSSYFDGGNIPWLTSSEVGQGLINKTESFITEDGLKNSSAKWIPANSVVVAMYGATVGKVGLLEIPCTTNQAVCSILPNNSIIPMFLLYAVKDKEEWMIDQAAGAAQPNISQAVIRKMEIPVPTKDEQIAFVEIAKQADKSKFAGFKSQFIEMYRTAPKEHVHLKDIATYSIGLTYKPENVKSTGIPVLRSGNIQEESLDFGDLVRVNSSIPDTLLLRDGDILMCSRNGSAHLVGKVARIRQLPEPMTYGAFMTVIRSEYMDYLFLFFQSDDFRQQISYGKSSTMNQITQKMLDQITLDLPSKDEIGRLSPLLEQADKSKYLN